MSQETAIIIGAGPAGLTAAFELLERTEIKPIVIEKSEHMGGISRTINYKGNRIDIGGHRFFSKSDRVMDWWLKRIPVVEDLDAQRTTNLHESPSTDAAFSEQDPGKEDLVMLVRQRKSRIYFLGRFFDYPISLSPRTLSGLGFKRAVRIGFSYMRSSLFPIKEEKSLEDFFINRFGRELYLTFFKSYTEKVWGVPCSEISAEWGAQRIKGLSIGKAIVHFMKQLFKKDTDISQEGTETSLIEQFLYPKYGPGQMWEKVAEEIRAKGGEILAGLKVDKIHVDGNIVTFVEATDKESGEKRVFEGKHFFSTMAIKDLVRVMDATVPPEIMEINEGLLYRDFITVGLLLKRLKIGWEDGGELIKDNWIYIQEPDVHIGRMQIFNNWSPYMVADPEKVWIGLEYFCYETDDIWKKSDEDMIRFAVDEAHKINLIEKADVLDGTVLRMPKTYPAYFGTYDRFEEQRSFLDQFENLYLVGRNGMHRYNNQDHSMLTAMTAVDNIVSGRKDKSNIWSVNIEQEYHENK